jgi:hypothetical protein
MSDLSPEARELLKAARDDFEASAEDCSRIDRALTARLGLAAGALAAATTATSVRAGAAGANGPTVAGASGTTAALVVKCVATVLLVAAAVGGVSIYRASRRDPALPPPVRVAEATPHAPMTVDTAATSPLATAAPVATAPVPSPSVIARPSPSEPHLSQSMLVPIARSPATAAHTPSSLLVTPEPSVGGLGSPDAMLGAETQLMRPADLALRTGDPARALELLDEHERRFPKGILAEERSAERVTALCALGRVDQAHTEATRFIATHADSPLVSRVSRSCGGDALGNRPRVP